MDRAHTAVAYRAGEVTRGGGGTAGYRAGGGRRAPAPSARANTQHMHVGRCGLLVIGVSADQGDCGLPGSVVHSTRREVQPGSNQVKIY